MYFYHVCVSFGHFINKFVYIVFVINFWLGCFLRFQFYQFQPTIKETNKKKVILAMKVLRASSTLAADICVFCWNTWQWWKQRRNKSEINEWNFCHGSFIFLTYRKKRLEKMLPCRLPLFLCWKTITCLGSYYQLFAKLGHCEYACLLGTYLG